MQSYTPLMALQKRELDRQNITQIAVRSGKGKKKLNEKQQQTINTFPLKMCVHAEKLLINPKDFAFSAFTEIQIPVWS